MSFAALMVHVNMDGSSDARVRLAATLDDRFAATLIGISAGALPLYPAEGAYFVSNEFIEQERADIVGALKKAEQTFRMLAGPDRPKLQWRCEVGLRAILWSRRHAPRTSSSLAATRYRAESVDPWIRVPPP
jgi:hypothetical protein